MKKLAILSKESVFGGYLVSNLGELADSLAVSLTSNYEVSLICVGTQFSFSQKLLKLQNILSAPRVRFAKINYYFLDLNDWDKRFEMVQKINPDILHIMSDVEDITKLKSRPQKVVFTFDSLSAIQGKEEILNLYDSITATSPSLLELAEQNEQIAEILVQKKAFGINNGMLMNFFTPEKGLLLPSAYSLKDLSGKLICKKKLANFYGISEQACIFLTGSLTQGTDLQNIIDLIPYIKENGGCLIIATRVPHGQEMKLNKMNVHDGVVYLGDSVNPAKFLQLISGADYYIQPSNPKMGSFAALAAEQYGTVPILDLNNIGLRDTFDENNSIIIQNENLQEAIDLALMIYNSSSLARGRNKESLIPGLSTDMDWRARKQTFINIYEE